MWFGYGAITFFASKGFYEKRARKAKDLPLEIKTSVRVCSPRRVGCMHGNEDSEGGMEIDESKGEAVYGESGGRTLFLNKMVEIFYIDIYYSNNDETWVTTWLTSFNYR